MFPTSRKILIRETLRNWSTRTQSFGAAWKYNVYWKDMQEKRTINISLALLRKLFFVLRYICTIFVHHRLKSGWNLMHVVVTDWFTFPSSFFFTLCIHTRIYIYTKRNDLSTIRDSKKKYFITATCATIYYTLKLFNTSFDILFLKKLVSFITYF